MKRMVASGPDGVKIRMLIEDLSAIGEPSRVIAAAEKARVLARDSSHALMMGQSQELVAVLSTVVNLPFFVPDMMATIVNMTANKTIRPQFAADPAVQRTLALGMKSSDRSIVRFSLIAMHNLAIDRSCCCVLEANGGIVDGLRDVIDRRNGESIEAVKVVMQLVAGTQVLARFSGDHALLTSLRRTLEHLSINLETSQLPVLAMRALLSISKGEHHRDANRIIINNEKLMNQVGVALQTNNGALMLDASVILSCLTNYRPNSNLIIPKIINNQSVIKGISHAVGRHDQVDYFICESVRNISAFLGNHQDIVNNQVLMDILARGVSSSQSEVVWVALPAVSNLVNADNQFSPLTTDISMSQTAIAKNGVLIGGLVKVLNSTNRDAICVVMKILRTFHWADSDTRRLLAVDDSLCKAVEMLRNTQVDGAWAVSDMMRDSRNGLDRESEERRRILSSRLDNSPIGLNALDNLPNNRIFLVPLSL